MAFSCRKAVYTGILPHFPDEKPEGFKAPARCAAAAIPLVPRPSYKCSTAAIRTYGDRRTQAVRGKDTAGTSSGRRLHALKNGF